ncbi:MAG: efflux RND transporter permease subunit [Rhodospirillales bacterium]|nr:efflux RND transporter permease subunit [Rhodospirillales bacterium]MCW9002240.1 efflux RND transporter permease subunit [Rhodospirillales bacterium]
MGPDKSDTPTGGSSYLKGGGLAAWSIRHPISVTMIALAIAVIGVMAYQSLAVALLPEIMYPGVRVRIVDPGVSAKVMEDKVARQLEEQLAITEDAIGVQSQTTEGSTLVDLTFQYGKDIDVALRDASTRLDRAKRFLPDTINPPMIYKFDPSQIPVVEFVIASPLRNQAELRDWVDYVFSKWFVNLPGVAAVEVGGGLLREIQIRPDPSRLSGLGISAADVVAIINRGNIEESAGRIDTHNREYVGRTVGRFTSIEEIRLLPLPLPGGGSVRLRDVADIVDGHQDERIRVRLDGEPGIKVSIQKQPTANTVSVVDAVTDRLAWLEKGNMLLKDVSILPVADQSIYVRSALQNATLAALGGAGLAMLIVFIFLGDIRRTLVVGTAIPLSILVTFALMGVGGLSLNIMTLGGLALGVGMVVDSTIVMLENVHRHQRMGENRLRAGQEAAREVNSAIIASTSTNLAAIVPFLFVTGLVGLLFRELIFTISAAIVASMIVALTVVPAYGSRVPVGNTGGTRRMIDGVMSRLEKWYVAALSAMLSRRAFKAGAVLALLAILGVSIPVFTSGKQVFLPSLDDGRIRVDIVADPGITVDRMDLDVAKLEALIAERPEVESIFTIVGGRIFGRSQRETSNQSTVQVQLVPLAQRKISSEEWVKTIQKEIGKLGMAGFKVRMRTGSIRGVRVNQGDDDITLRIAGPDLAVMEEIGFQVLSVIKDMPSLRNATHSSEELRDELVFRVDHDRIAELGLSVSEVARAARLALEGEEVTEFVENDRSYVIRVRLPQQSADTVQSLESVLIAAGGGDIGPVYLGDVATVELVSSTAEIRRDNQRRIIEVTATLSGDAALSDVSAALWRNLSELQLPDGYTIYDTGAAQTLKEGRQMNVVLLVLAVFLVFVVMAVQYESLRNPLIILLAIPFTVVGVAGGLLMTGIPLSMPVWLGIIMLCGIVVNNAIVLVEYFEIMRHRGLSKMEAIIEAGRVRLRPILMTTLTTVFGLLPLAIGIGEGAELLQPLAITIVSGLSFSMLVTLVLIPILCLSFGGARREG